MRNDYDELQPHDLKPGTLCTVLELRKKKIRPHIVGDVALVNPQEERSCAGAVFKGWPLRVRHKEHGSPFVILDVLGGGPMLGVQVNSALLDERLVKFGPVSREYVRQILNQPYQTTL